MVSQIKYALETTGFFLVENHGIPQHLISSAMAMQRAFFHQNISTKQQYAKRFDNSTHAISGWFQNELLYGATPDRKESYDFLLHSLVDDFADGIWFDDVQLTDMLDLAVSMKSTTQSLFRALSLALGGPETLLSGFHDHLVNTYLRFVYYAQDDARDEPGMLLHPHTDFLSLTLGFQDETGGLEVWNKASKQWVQVPYIEGAAIVNIGDAMQRWSNDRFVANFHRIHSDSVAASTAGERFSMYMFVGPRHDQVIDPRVFGIEDAEAHYPPKLFTEYYAERIKNTFEASERDDHHATGDADAVKDMAAESDVRGCTM